MEIYSTPVFTLLQSYEQIIQSWTDLGYSGASLNLSSGRHNPADSYPWALGSFIGSPGVLTCFGLIHGAGVRGLNCEQA